MFIPQPYLNCFVCSLLHNPLRMPSVLCTAWKKTVRGNRCVSVYVSECVTVEELRGCFLIHWFVNMFS